MSGQARHPLPEDIVSALPKIRTLCAAFDNCRETLTYGNPTFKRGPRNFLVLDRYKGRSCLWLLVDPAVRDDMLAVDGWFPSPYDPRKIALCCHLDRLDWTSVAHLIKASYHLAQR